MCIYMWVCVCVSWKPWSYLNVEMNSYLFTQKKSECEDPKGEVQNNTEREREREGEGGRDQYRYRKEREKQRLEKEGKWEKAEKEEKWWKCKKEGSLKR